MFSNPGRNIFTLYIWTLSIHFMKSEVEVMMGERKGEWTREPAALFKFISNSFGVLIFLVNTTYKDEQIQPD